MYACRVIQTPLFIIMRLLFIPKKWKWRLKGYMIWRWSQINPTSFIETIPKTDLFMRWFEMLNIVLMHKKDTFWINVFMFWQSKNSSLPLFKQFGFFFDCIYVHTYIYNNKSTIRKAIGRIELNTRMLCYFTNNIKFWYIKQTS